MTTEIVREDTHCRHMSYSFRLAARVLLYALSHRQDEKHHVLCFLCYTSRGAFAGTRNSSMDRSDDPPHHKRTLLQRSYIPLLLCGRKKIFYLLTHSTHFIYGYMASDIWLRTILIVREETRCRNIGYSFRLAARVLLYAPSNRQDSTYHSLCYTSRGALAGTKNSSYFVEVKIQYNFSF